MYLLEEQILSLKTVKASPQTSHADQCISFLQNRCYNIEGYLFPLNVSGRVVRSVSQRSWVRYPIWPHTFVSPSADSRGAVVSYWRKYVPEVLVNRLEGLSLPRKSVVRSTDRPDMTLVVYRRRKTTTQQQQQQLKCFSIFEVTRMGSVNPKEIKI